MNFGKPALVKTRQLARDSFGGEYGYKKSEWRIVPVIVEAAP
jgi:hypothetical protein